MGFIQIVEFTTSDIDAMRARGDQYDQAGGSGGKGTLCADRDNPGRYVVVAEFDSYEEAMKNSERQETQELAADMAKLADGPASYRNLDVIEVWGD